MGQEVIVADIGVLDPPLIKADIPREEIAKAAGADINQLAAAKDEGKASLIMSEGLTKIATKMYERGEIAGIIGMGGTWGTSTCAAIMRAFPVGVPKVLVSTIAARDIRPIIGTKDIVLIHSVADIAGLNRITKKVLANAAAAITGMVSLSLPREEQKPLVGMSTTGGQFPCAIRVKKILEEKGFEVVIFHAVGSGGRTLETLVKEGDIDSGVIDLAMVEIYSTLFDPGSPYDAGQDRLEAPGTRGLPHVIVPGCADFMAIIPGRIPPKFEKYKMYMHNPAVIVAKMEKEDVKILAKFISEKVNKAPKKKAVIVPTQGFSTLDKLGHAAGFHDPEIRRTFIAELKKLLDPSVKYIEVDAHVNDPEFADVVAKVFLDIVKAESVLEKA